ncbi:MAG: hypothetical protein LQ340_006177, partial [Diploschistes diacapsis]
MHNARAPSYDSSFHPSSSGRRPAAKQLAQHAATSSTTTRHTTATEPGSARGIDVAQDMPGIARARANGEKAGVGP